VVLFCVGFLILLLDQFIKNFLISRPNFIEFIGWKYLNVTLVKNTGTAFGLFEGSNILFTILALITIAVITIIFFKTRKRSFSFRLSLIFILSGALSNLIDRLRFGYVIDYIDLKFWPVFNIADSAVTTGIILLMLIMLVNKEA